MKKNAVIFITVIIILTCSCSNSEPSETAIQTAIIQTQQAQVIGEETEVMPEEATNTPVLTNTPLPTNTPVSTNIPVPTNTPLPTNTPTLAPSPTPVPQPLVFSGDGSDIINVTDYWNGPAIVYAKSTGSRNFIVRSYDQDGARLELLVNEIAPNEGYYPMGFRESDTAVTRLELDSRGPWEITIFPLSVEYIPITANVPTSFDGNGNTIIYVEPDADLLIVKSTGKSNFIVYAYTLDGDRNLIVNKIAPFDGKFILPNNTFLLTVDADGGWNFEFTER